MKIIKRNLVRNKVNYSTNANNFNICASANKKNHTLKNFICKNQKLIMQFVNRYFMGNFKVESRNAGIIFFYFNKKSYLEKKKAKIEKVIVYKLILYG